MGCATWNACAPGCPHSTAGWTSHRPPVRLGAGSLSRARANWEPSIPGAHPPSTSSNVPSAIAHVERRSPSPCLTGGGDPPGAKVLFTPAGRIARFSRVCLPSPTANGCGPCPDPRPAAPNGRGHMPMHPIYLLCAPDPTTRTIHSGSALLRTYYIIPYTASLSVRQTGDGTKRIAARRRTDPSRCAPGPRREAAR